MCSIWSLTGYAFLGTFVATFVMGNAHNGGAKKWKATLASPQLWIVSYSMSYIVAAIEHSGDLYEVVLSLPVMLFIPLFLGWITSKIVKFFLKNTKWYNDDMN